MKKYLIETVVKLVEGSQFWTVEALNEAHALKVFRRGGGDYVEAELEVLDLHEPEVVGLYEPTPKPDTGAELEYLRFFLEYADFGPAHEDVVDHINNQYTESTGRPVPTGYESN